MTGDPQRPDPVSTGAMSADEAPESPGQGTPPGEVPAQEETQPQRRPGLLSRLREYVLVVVIAVALSFGVKTLLVQPFWIPSGSMEQTLVTGDRIVVNKLPGSTGDIQRGDIVVFEDPNNWLPPVPESGGATGALKKGLQFVGLYPAGEQHLVKRVIGVGGDQVVCCDRTGRLTVNGKVIQETYLQSGLRASDTRFSIRVPQGRLWLMGDNRGNSEDSRAHDEDSGGRVGSVPESAVTGKVLAVVWPLGRAERPADAASVFRGVPDR